MYPMAQNQTKYSDIANW